MVGNVVHAAAVGDIIKDGNGVAYSITSLDPAEVKVARQDQNDGVTSGNVVIPSTITVDGTDYSVTALVQAAFANSAFTTLVLSDGITEIPTNCFTSATAPSSLTFPSTLTTISRNAFKSITLPSVTCYATEPPTTAGFNQTYITNLYVPSASVETYKESDWASIATNILAISDDSGDDDETGNYAVGDIIYDDNGVAYEVTSSTEVSVAKQCTNGGVYASGNSVVIPSTVSGYTVTAVGENAFYDTTYGGNGGIDAITLPTTITTIGDNAFNYCSNLTTVDIPEGVTTLGDGVFGYCTSVTSISLPSTLTSIGAKVFSHCTAMTELTCLATTAPTLSENSIFNGLTQTVTLWVPCGSTSSYDTWVSAMSSKSNGGTLTVSELDCTGNEGGDDEEGEDDGTVSVPVDGTEFTYSESGKTYFSITIPDEAGTLVITQVDGLYDNSECSGDPIEGTWNNSYSSPEYTYTDLTPGAKYYWTAYPPVTYTATYTSNSSEEQGDDNDENGGDTSSEGYTTSDGIEITPALGTVTSISSIRFAHDPISISWGYDGTTYHESDVQIVDASGAVVAQGYTDGYDEEYSGWNPDTAITFYLNNEVTEDGTYTLKVPDGFFYLDEAGSTYSAAIEVEYTIGEGSDGGETEEEAAITLVSPESEDGVIYAASWSDDTQVIFKSSTKQGEVDWKITDVTEGVDEDDAVLYSSFASYNSSTDQFVSEIYNFGGITFYENHTYELTGYIKSGATTLVEEMLIVTIIGTTPEENNPVSTVTLVSSDPEYSVTYSSSKEIEVVSGEDLPITLTFSDYVKITASINQSQYGGSVSLSAVGVDEGNGEGCYKVWLVTIPAEQLADETYDGEITVTISGTDANGKLFYDESGYNTYNYFYTVTGDTGEQDLTGYTFDPENESTVSELSTITVGNELGIAVSWIGTITITDDDGNTVETLTGDNCEDNYENNEEPDANSGHDGTDTGWSTSYSVTITLSEAITTAGTYTVNIPNGFFIIGTEQENTNSPAMTLTYTVEAEETVENVDISFDPENGSTVEELSTIEMWIEDADEFDLGDAGWDTTLYVLNADGDQVALLDYSGWNDEATAIVFAVADTEEWEHMTITDAGTYTIDIPEGFLYAGDAQSNAVTLTYTIGDNSEETEYSYTVNPADGTTVSSLSTITISCETGIYVSLDGISGSFSDIKVYNEDGDEVTSASTINSVDAGTYYDLGEEIVLADEIVEAGEYTVVIPEGTLAYFVDGRDGDIDLGEITLTYTVDGTLDGINTIKAAISEGAEVYNLAGQRVVTPVKGSVNVVKYADGTVKKVLQK